MEGVAVDVEAAVLFPSETCWGSGRGGGCGFVLEDDVDGDWELDMMAMVLMMSSAAIRKEDGQQTAARLP